MKIALTGDLFLGGDLTDYKGTELVSVASFADADVRVVNLEQAASDGPFVADKSTLHTGTAALGRLIDLGVDVVGVANNHIHDKGPDGIISTVQEVRALGLRPVGAGRDLQEARQATKIAPGYVLLAYCDFGRPYLQDVATATEQQPGTAPLRLDIIEADLAALPRGDQAVLYMHWGREHVRLPPSQDIEVSKRLLAHPRVAGIVGMHAHRIQGAVEVDGKRAYMCLGNFLFPNFYLAPPVQITPRPTDNARVPVTRRYHGVVVPTYKKWLRVNRTSLVVVFDTETGTFSHSVVVQSDGEPLVRDANFLASRFNLFLFALLSRVYMIDRSSYDAIHDVESRLRKWHWDWRTRITRARQMGLRGSTRRVAAGLRTISRRNSM